MSNAIILVAPEDQLRAWTPHLVHRGTVIGMPETAVPRIVETIRSERPTLVALDSSFAATPRGTALLARLTDDPTLDACEICLIAAQGRGISLSSYSKRASQVAAAHDPRGTRRRPRYQFPVRPAVRLGGVQAQLVDLSIRGAQVTAQIPFWPGERRELTLEDSDTALRIRAAVVWARPEQPAKPGSAYRIGLQFQEEDGQSGALKAYSLRQLSGTTRK
jgi:hypothetical protein